MNETKLVNYPLFKGMSKEEHDAFLQRNIKEIVKFKKGNTVARQGIPFKLVEDAVRTQMKHIHRTFRRIAQRGRCSMGWFFGFKLHLI